MITFTRDTLVPPELCELLYQTVPTEYHVPVFFNNHRTHPGHSRSMGGYHKGDPRAITINLNPLFCGTLNWGTQRAGSLASKLWRGLVEVCYHEFGHAVNEEQCQHVSMAEYNAEGRGYKWVEKLADGWRDERIQVLLDHDTRLAQPARLGGYYGAILSGRYNHLKATQNEHGCNKAHFVAMCRCMKTGGQYTAGDMLTVLGEPKLKHRKRYALLRRISDGIGIDYVDAAGRKHKLYTHGDVPVLRSRLCAYTRLGYNTGTLYQQKRRAAQVYHHPRDPDPNAEWTAKG